MSRESNECISPVIRHFPISDSQSKEGVQGPRALIVAYRWIFSSNTTPSVASRSSMPVVVVSNSRAVLYVPIMILDKLFPGGG